MQSPSILILEHINTLARVYSLALQGMGYSVKTISDGATALDYLAQNTPAVILLDLRILGISGTEVLAYVKSQRRLKNTKVVLMSADSQLEQHIEKWADCVLDKPAQLRDISAAVRNMSQPPVPPVRAFSFA